MNKDWYILAPYALMVGFSVFLYILIYVIRGKFGFGRRAVFFKCLEEVRYLLKIKFGDKESYSYSEIGSVIDAGEIIQLSQSGDFVDDIYQIFMEKDDFIFKFEGKYNHISYETRRSMFLNMFEDYEKYRKNHFFVSKYSEINESMPATYWKLVLERMKRRRDD